MKMMGASCLKDPHGSVFRIPLVSDSQEQPHVRRRADKRGTRRAEGPQGIEPRRVCRPQLGEVETERPRSPACDPLELADGLALQPILQAHDSDARIRLTRDVEGHWVGASACSSPESTEVPPAWPIEPESMKSRRHPDCRDMS